MAIINAKQVTKQQNIITCAEKIEAIGSFKSLGVIINDKPKFKQALRIKDKQYITKRRSIKEPNLYMRNQFYSYYSILSYALVC